MARKGVYCRCLFCHTYICTEVFALPNGKKAGASGTIVGKNHYLLVNIHCYLGIIHNYLGKKSLSNGKYSYEFVKCSFIIGKYS